MQGYTCIVDRCMCMNMYMYVCVCIYIYIYRGPVKLNGSAIHGRTTQGRRTLHVQYMIPSVGGERDIGLAGQDDYPNLLHSFLKSRKLCGNP